MSKLFLFSLLVLAFAGCQRPETTGSQESPTPSRTFAQARSQFQTKLTRTSGEKGEPETPPAGLFSLVEYSSKLGPMPAYLSNIPKDGKQHPAVIWILGGFGNSIGDVWSEEDPSNDQTAAVIREAGIVMMYPAQRGGNTSPGADETCYGEIDDILAAAEFLAKQSGVDPERIYLAGHSTGGTKAILAAEASNVFRAVFSLGPVAAVEDYGPEYFTFDTRNRQEFEMREPLRWLSSLTTPLYIFEGVEGNISSLRQFQEAVQREGTTLVHCHELQGKDHFSGIHPVCAAIAKQILADNKGGQVTMDFEADIRGMR